MKKVEVIIPVFNDLSISDTLEHLANQSNSRDLSVTVVDNCSSNDILHVITNFVGRLSIRYIRHEQFVSFEENFVRAASEAVGEFVTFCGAGDLIDVRELILTVNQLPLDFADGLIGGRFALTRAGRYRIQDFMPEVVVPGFIPQDQILSWCLNGPLSGLGGWIISRRALVKHLAALISPSNTRFPQVLLGLSVGTTSQVIQTPNCWYLQTSELDPARQKNAIYRDVAWIERFTNHAARICPNDTDLIHRLVGQSTGRNLLSFHAFAGRGILFKAARVSGELRGPPWLVLYLLIAAAISVFPRCFGMLLISAIRTQRTGQLNRDAVFQLLLRRRTTINQL